MEKQWEVMNKCKNLFFKRSTVYGKSNGQNRKYQIYSTILRMRKGLHPDVWKLKITKC